MTEPGSAAEFVRLLEAQSMGRHLCASPLRGCKLIFLSVAETYETVIPPKGHFVRGGFLPDQREENED